MRWQVHVRALRDYCQHDAIRAGVGRVCHARDFKHNAVARQRFTPTKAFARLSSSNPTKSAKPAMQTGRKVPGTKGNCAAEVVRTWDATGPTPVAPYLRLFP